MDLINPPEDMSSEEKQAVADFRAAGCPGLTKIDADKVAQWFELYMSGKTYLEISELVHFHKNIVLYVAFRGNWHEKKMSKYNDITHNLWSKSTSAKIESANNVATMISALNRYYMNKFNKYLATNDDSIIETIDTAMLGRYQRTIEMLEKLISAGKVSDVPTLPAGDRPSVNININGPTEIVDTSKTIEITGSEPKVSHGEILKALLKLKKG